MSFDVRWKQRFANFDRALALLAEASANIGGLSMLEKEGAIQRFEYTLELGWKTLKDYLEAGGLVIAPVTPRQVVKEAFAAKVLSDGQVWIDMIDSRNLLSHTYDSAVFEKIAADISARYLPALKTLHAFLAPKAGK
jgi:nucleotidyltransferase substrate binding protein (TIGR01987 family)